MSTSTWLHILSLSQSRVLRRIFTVLHVLKYDEATNLLQDTLSSPSSTRHILFYYSSSFITTSFLLCISPLTKVLFDCPLVENTAVFFQVDSGQLPRMKLSPTPS